MTLDRFIFDCVDISPCVATAGCVMAKVSVRPRISGEVVMHVLVEGYVISFIGLEGKKNWIVLHQLSQDWFEVIAMYETWMPCANSMKTF